MVRGARARPSAAVLFGLLACACDDVNIGAPDVPPPPQNCLSLDDYARTVTIVRPPGTNVAAVSIVGPLVYAAAGSAGVLVVDTADPLDARVVASLDALRDARALDARGDIVAVANGADGLALVAATGTPRVLGVAAMPGRAVGVALDGMHAYVANEVIGLVIVDVSDASLPVIRGIENTPGQAVEVAVANGVALVADQDLGVRVVNVSDVRAPFLLRTIETPARATGVAASGGVGAVTVGQMGLRMIDLSSPATAAIVGMYNTPGSAVAVLIDGDQAFVADGGHGVTVLDIRDPAAPRFVSAVGTAWTTSDIDLDDGHLATAEGAAGVRVLQVDPPEPPPVDSLLTGSDIRAIAAFDGYLVLADATFGLRVFDPATRSVVGELALTNGAKDVYVVGSLAYVARAGVGDVPVVDLSLPSSPVQVDQVTVVGEVDAVVVEGPDIYMLSGNRSVQARKLDGSGLPVNVTRTNAFFPSMAIDGVFVYLADRQSNVYMLRRFDINSSLVFPTGGSAERVVLRQTPGPFGPVTRAYVAISGRTNGAAGVEVYDLSNPLAPVRLAVYIAGGTAIDVAFDGDLMAVSAGEDGTEVFEIVSGARARPIGYLPAHANRAWLRDGMVLTGGSGGLAIVGIDDCP